MRPSAKLRILPADAPDEPGTRGIAADDCWNQIGVHGDRSCDELAKVVHCLNCRVFAEGGQRLFDRAPPDGYLEESSASVAASPVPPALLTFSALVFRVDGEWLALDTRFIVEVSELRPTHRLPHRESGALEGLVNVRGRLELLVRLNRMMTLTAPATGFATTPRLVVASREGRVLVFRVDEVDGVRSFADAHVVTPPTTVGRAQSLVSGLIGSGARQQGRWVGRLDPERLWAAFDQVLA
jgi:chemotaxis-related protein WspD